MAVQIRSVLVADAVDEQCDGILRQHGLQVTRKLRMAPEELLQQVKLHDALVVRSDTKVTAAVLAAGASASLRAVGRAGTGVDNIDVDAATRKGVVVINTPGGNSISACELTCGLIMSLARNIPAGCSSLKQGQWDRKKLTGCELAGKTLAVLGLGRIGREVATRMSAFGMTVVGFDPIVTAEAALEFGVEKLELEQIWPRADFITVHTPLIPQTTNLVGEAALNKCKRGVRVVNVARGGIVDERALLQALKDGRCGGAALDVFCEEPPKSEHLLELVRHPLVVPTPHLGASTTEAQTRVAIEVAEQLVALASNVPATERTRYQLTGVVNAPALSASVDDRNAPWLQLCQQLGQLAGNMDDTSILQGTTIQVAITGPLRQRLSSFAGSAILSGLMTGRTPNGLNLVNAAALASEAGVTLERTTTDEKKDQPSNETVVTLTVSRKGGQQHVLQGSLSAADQSPQLLSVDGCQFAGGVPLDRPSLSLTLVQPSQVAATVAAAGAAISSVHVARNKGGPLQPVWVAVRTADV